MRRVGPVLVCAASVVVAARVAPAEEIVLVYQAPPECPDELSFWNELTLRSGAEPARGEARTFTVELHRHPEGVRGVLTLRERDGRSTRRHVEGATCVETVKALALVAALALEEAALAPAPAPPEAPPPPPREPPAPRVTPRPWSLGAGVHVGASAGAAPATLIGVPLFVEVAPPALARLRFRAHLIRASAGKEIMPAEHVDFESTVGRLDACAFESRFLRRFTALPCLTIEAGRLRARATGVDDAREEARPWVAPGVAGRVAVQAWRALWLEIEGNTTFPLIRDRFYLAPETTIHRVPLITLGLSAGVAVVFP